MSISNTISKFILSFGSLPLPIDMSDEERHAEIAELNKRIEEYEASTSKPVDCMTQPEIEAALDTTRKKYSALLDADNRPPLEHLVYQAVHNKTLQ